MSGLAGTQGQGFSMIEDYVLTDKQEDVYDKVSELSESSENGVVRADKIDADRTIDALVTSGLIYRENIRGVEFLSNYAITEKMVAQLCKQVDPPSPSHDSEEDDSGETSDKTSDDDEYEPDKEDESDTELDESFFSQFKGIGDKSASKIIEKVDDMGIGTKSDLLEIDLTELPYVSDKRAKTINEKLQDDVDNPSLENLDESIDKLKKLSKKVTV